MGKNTKKGLQKRSAKQQPNDTKSAIPDKEPHKINDSILGRITEVEDKIEKLNDKAQQFENLIYNEEFPSTSKINNLEKRYTQLVKEVDEKLLTNKQDDEYHQQINSSLKEIKALIVAVNENADSDDTNKNPVEPENTADVNSYVYFILTINKFIEDKGIEAPEFIEKINDFKRDFPEICNLVNGCNKNKDDDKNTPVNSIVKVHQEVKEKATETDKQDKITAFKESSARTRNNFNVKIKGRPKGTGKNQVIDNKTTPARKAQIKRKRNYDLNEITARKMTLRSSITRAQANQKQSNSNKDENKITSSLVPLDQDANENSDPNTGLIKDNSMEQELPQSRNTSITNDRQILKKPVVNSLSGSCSRKNNWYKRTYDE